MSHYKYSGLRGGSATSVGGLSVQDVLALVRDPPAEREILLGHSVNVSSMPLRVFRKWGVKCVGCGIEGLFFSLEWHTKSPEERTHPHLALYAVEENRRQVRINIDHTVPLSGGGTWSLDNLRPMCIRCNADKGSRTLTPAPLGLPCPEPAAPRLLHQIIASCRDCPHVRWSERKGGMVCVRAHTSPWLTGAEMAAQPATELHDPSLPPLFRWKPIPQWCPLPLAASGIPGERSAMPVEDATAERAG